MATISFCMSKSCDRADSCSCSFRLATSCCDMSVTVRPGATCNCRVPLRFFLATVATKVPSSTSIGEPFSELKIIIVIQSESVLSRGLQIWTCTSTLTIMFHPFVQSGKVSRVLGCFCLPEGFPLEVFS